jgi:phi13 family phage major tail protein
MDKLYYAKITEGENGEETYGTPIILAKAIKADLSIELAEAILYADDAAAYVAREFKSGKLSLGVDDIGRDAAADLVGAKTDSNGVLVSSSEDSSDPVAVGFRARKANDKYRYFWLYRVKFGVPSTNLATKGDSISFQTPTIEGIIMRRNKPDAKGDHPWKAEANEDDTGVAPTVISGWYNTVYEPQQEEQPA